MVKILVTGHTSGIGKHLYENLDGDIVGASRSNDKPITKISEWFDESYDLFINNAYDDSNFTAQSEALEYAYSKWKDNSSKMIISIGTNAPDIEGYHTYNKGKTLLDKVNFDCYMETDGVKCSLVRPGWVDTPRITEWWDGKKLKVGRILEVVNFIINFDGRIREITLENK